MVCLTKYSKIFFIMGTLVFPLSYSWSDTYVHSHQGWAGNRVNDPNPEPRLIIAPLSCNGETGFSYRYGGLAYSKVSETPNGPLLDYVSNLSLEADLSQSKFPPPTRAKTASVPEPGVPMTDNESQFMTYEQFSELSDSQQKWVKSKLNYLDNVEQPKDWFMQPRPMNVTLKCPDGTEKKLRYFASAVLTEHRTVEPLACLSEDPSSMTAPSIEDCLDSYKAGVEKVLKKMGKTSKRLTRTPTTAKPSRVTAADAPTVTRQNSTRGLRPHRTPTRSSGMGGAGGVRHGENSTNVVKSVRHR